MNIEKELINNHLIKIDLEDRIEHINATSKQIAYALGYYDEKSIHATYLNSLLKVSLSKSKTNTAHPSFLFLILQLSEDELNFLETVHNTPQEYVRKMDYNREQNRFENRVDIVNPHPEIDLTSPGQFNLYVSNLLRLDLIEYPIYKQDPIVEDGTQTGLTQYSRIEISIYGQSFLNAILNPGR